ncbi:unnamed protein product [Trichogramma brassicae]|uniref:Uncharacterized protein n=1 Tax=Trichogramma brassicae TaxID=86971 RepID=A0A6H5I6C0_9HYME|nr:unnamed protein product [Trichogramma brassicae]
MGKRKHRDLSTSSSDSSTEPSAPKHRKRSKKSKKTKKSEREGRGKQRRRHHHNHKRSRSTSSSTSTSSTRSQIVDRQAKKLEDPVRVQDEIHTSSIVGRVIVASSGQEAEQQQQSESSEKESRLAESTISNETTLAADNFYHNCVSRLFLMITPTQFFHVHENPNLRNSRPYYVTINFKHMTRRAAAREHDGGAAETPGQPRPRRYIAIVSLCGPAQEIANFGKIRKNTANKENYFTNIRSSPLKHQERTETCRSVTGAKSMDTPRITVINSQYAFLEPDGFAVEKMPKTNTERVKKHRLLKKEYARINQRITCSVSNRGNNYSTGEELKQGVQEQIELDHTVHNHACYDELHDAFNDYNINNDSQESSDDEFSNARDEDDLNINISDISFEPSSSDDDKEGEECEEDEEDEEDEECEQGEEDDEPPEIAALKECHWIRH